jgi:hypothetical protein
MPKLLGVDGISLVQILIFIINVKGVQARMSNQEFLHSQLLFVIGVRHKNRKSNHGFQSPNLWG